MQLRRWYSYGIFLALFLAYLTIQSRAFLLRPLLSLSYGQNTFTVSQSSVVITGKTSPQAELFVNGEEVSVALSGDFSLPLSLFSGINTVTITARSPFGRERIRTLTIIVNSKAQDS